MSAGSAPGRPGRPGGRVRVRAHLLFGAALAVAALAWLAIRELTPLGACEPAVRTGSLVGLLLALLAAGLGYASLVWAGGRSAGDAAAGAPEARRAAEGRRSRRVVGVYVAGALLRLAVIFGAALALERWAGMSAGAVLLTAVAAYVPLSFVEVLLLAAVLA